MNPIEIRKATINDLEELQKISIKTFSETFAAVNTHENITDYIKNNLNTSQLTAELNNKNSQFYVACYNATVVGYLKINFGVAQTESIKENAMEVQRIYVLQTFHGKNIGQLLLEQAKKIAQTTSVDYIWLGVWEENHKAIRFYIKNGFIVFDQHVFKMGNDNQIDLLMQYKIQ
jgi:ribosomal protein S18 acetylase RimI-like enzyme